MELLPWEIQSNGDTHSQLGGIDIKKRSYLTLSYTLESFMQLIPSYNN